jgi:hypothetical protein
MNKIKFTMLFLFVFSNSLMAGPLHDAIRQKQWSTAKILLAEGADPNEELNGQNAIQIYMTVVSETLESIVNHYSNTIPVQQPWNDLLSMNDSISILNTFDFYAEILPHLSPETVLNYAIQRATLAHEFKLAVEPILERCRLFFPDTNPQFSMFELIKKIKTYLIDIIQESGVIEGPSGQLSPEQINLIVDQLSKILEDIKQMAASLGFELSEAQILSMMMIQLVSLDPLPEEKAICFADNQPSQSNAETLNQQPVPATETETSETQPLLEELSLYENATTIPETWPPLNPGMELIDFLPPTSH